MPDLGHRAAGKTQRHRNRIEALPQHHQVCGIDRDLGSSPHRDAHIRRSQSRRVIDPIPDHANGAETLPRLVDAIQLLLWEQFPGQLLGRQAQLGRKVLHRRLSIATQQTQRQTHRSQLGKRAWGVLPRLIIEGDQPLQLADARSIAQGHGNHRRTLRFLFNPPTPLLLSHRHAVLKQPGGAMAEEQRRWWTEQEAQGSTVVAVALSDAAGVSQLQGLIALDDQAREDAPGALAQLRAMGLALGLLSGDRQAPVQHLAAQLGLPPEELAWELLPQQKLDRIDHARQGFSPVGMVGDGINDAPALAAADVGIAVGTGTQIAIDTADLVLLGERLEAIPMALRLARRTMAKVRQNLIWAFGYNLVVLPIAAGVLLPGFGVVLSPPLAALLMAMSSITVVVNALLLGRDD